MEAASFDERIDDYLERCFDIYERCFEWGKDAVVVKAADRLDNSDYYHLGESAELRENQIEKMHYFVEESEPYIGDDEIHQDLEGTLPAVKERIENHDR